jgi:hypothetical protein
MHREAVGTASTRERRPKISAPISGGEYVAEEIATAATTAQAAKNIPTTKRPTVIGLVISPMPIAFTAFAMPTTRDECLGNDAAPVRSRNSAFSPRPLSNRQAGTPTNPGPSRARRGYFKASDAPPKAPTRSGDSLRGSAPIHSLCAGGASGQLPSRKCRRGAA